MSSPKIVPRKKTKTISESALLAVARIVGNQQDILQKWLRRRDARHQHRLSDAHQALGFGSFAHSGLGCLIVVANPGLMAVAVRPSHWLACNFCLHILCPDRIDGGRIEA